jgi:DNA polymerase-4
VEARHEIYVDYHHRIVEAVESCLPVTAVLSIDEMACRLMGRERPLLAAIDLGRKVKAAIRDKVGVTLRSSVGIATNRYLAKVASDMEKPDGLVALPLDILPQALRQLTLRDLPGIGARTEERLNQQGIRTMDDLLSLDCEKAGALWGSVWGERLWHWLRGEDFDMAETEHLKSISTCSLPRCAPRKKRGPSRTNCSIRQPCACAPANCGPAASDSPSALPAPKANADP